MPAKSLNTGLFYRSVNQLIIPHQQHNQEDDSEKDDHLDDEKDVRPQAGKRNNQRKKKQKKRRKHGRRRQAVIKPIEEQVEQDEQVNKEPRTFQKPAGLRVVEQEDDKQPSPVEELLRLNREATVTTVLKFDMMVGKALRKKKESNN